MILGAQVLRYSYLSLLNLFAYSGSEPPDGLSDSINEGKECYRVN